jgi:hypothetical protein
LTEEEERWIKWFGCVRKMNRMRILRRALQLKFIEKRSVGHSRLRYWKTFKNEKAANLKLKRLCEEMRLDPYGSTLMDLPLQPINSFCGFYDLTN